MESVTTQTFTQVKSGVRCSIDMCYKKVKQALGRFFSWYGERVGNHPVVFIILPILIFGGLGVGLLRIDEETDLETVYFPMNSRAIKDRQTVRDLFPDMNNQSYNSFSQSDAEQSVALIFVSKSGSTIFDNDTVTEIRRVLSEMKGLTASVGSEIVTFRDVCARSSSQCVVDGEFLLSSGFLNALAAGGVTYPYWALAGNNIDLRNNIAGVKKQGDVILSSATVLRISFKLAQKAPQWQKQFETHASNLSLMTSEVAYETPDSLNVELDKSTKGDILFFSLTITICCTYASLVTSGGDPVSTRSMLAFAGILAAGLGIVGSMGLLTLIGVKFVNIVGVIPFLIIGIGIDDMFLIMSSWSETLGNTELSVPQRVGTTLASAGIGITITSLTDLLAFVIGTTSVFRSVTNFSLYAGIAVLFCYLANVTMFCGCLTIHGRRVYSARHFLTCRKTEPREDLEKKHRSPCFVCCCGGSPPKVDRADVSICEKIPTLFLPDLFTRKLFCIAIIVGFMGYLAAAIYGVINLPQGLVLKNLVKETSYYHRYLTLQDEHFPTTLPVGFIIHSKIDYTSTERQQFLDLLAEVRQDSRMMPGFERCWLSSFLNSSFYVASAPQDFVRDVSRFVVNVSDFLPDVVFDASNTSIMASRCFVMSEPNSDQYAMADLMERLRKLADDSPLPVFAYHSAFVAYEQFLAVLPATLQMVGCAVAVMTVVTFLFLPHPLMVLLVVVTIVMILTGIIGFMYYWNLTLSSITMIHLVMSVGFSVDFSAHVCAAYLLSDREKRKDRAADAIKHAAAPILNGAISTLLGVLLLVFSSSYVFFSFFQIMLLVIVLGMLHAVLFLPAVLSLMGPENKVTEVRPSTNQSARSVFSIDDGLPSSSNDGGVTEMNKTHEVHARPHSGAYREKNVQTGWINPQLEKGPPHGVGRSNRERIPTRIPTPPPDYDEF